ncbi:MAG: hypothetical protein GX444_12875 [Myxococcales bacterium]|nr:hypothetical protein [Myxococcales bacterium]
MISKMAARAVKKDKKRDEPAHLRRFLHGSFDHYSTVFHGRFGLLLNLFFRFLFGPATINDADREEIRRAAEKGAVCYVIRGRSRLEYLLLSYKLRRENLPFPQFCHYLPVYWWQPWTTFIRRTVGILVSLWEKKGYPNPYANGYVEDLVEKRMPMLLPLHHFSGLPRRFLRGKSPFDPLQALLRIQRETDTPILLVPLFISYGRRPQRETRTVIDLIAGPPDNPGRLRRLWQYLRNRSSVYIKVAQPQELEDLEEAVRMRVPEMLDPEPETAYHIRRALLERLEEERRTVLGPARKSRTEIVEMVLHDRRFLAAIMDYCKKNDQPFIETRRRARRYLEEMAADQRPWAAGLLRFTLDRLLPRVYESVEVNTDSLEQVRKVMRKSPVVFVPSHKSHIDYLILGYVLDQHHLPMPLTVSGINLNFWPLGPVFRGAGAFFIRRAFRGKRIYTLCLVRYLETVLREGLSLTFYVEGSRSRVGKLLVPKTGFLQYLLEASAMANRSEIAFVPVSIGYERIFEERFYTNEAAGKPNEGENLRTMLRNRRMLTKSRGRVWIDFAAPILLNDLVWNRAAASPADDEARRDLAKRIAYRVVHDINELQPVTSYAIVAEALLAGVRRGVPAETVARRYALLRDYLRYTHTVMPESPVSVEIILATMVAEKVLTFETGEEDEPPYYLLEESKRLPLTIYANTVIPHHQAVSLLSLAMLGLPGPQPAKKIFDHFRFLVGLLKREFIFGGDPARSVEADREEMEKALAFGESQGWIDKRPEGLALSATGQFAAETFAAVATGYVESYHLAARTLAGRKAERTFEKDLIKLTLKKGERLVSLGELAHPEAVHKITIENAMHHFADLGVLRGEMIIADKTKAANHSYQVADFVQLREIIDRTSVYLPKK